jgi:hypothetical protein
MAADLWRAGIHVLILEVTMVLVSIRRSAGPL